MLEINVPSPHSAKDSLMGYLYQCRYALYDSLRRLSQKESFAVSVEALDDVVFQKSDDALDLLQTKHHINRKGNLSDASTDIWKTIRNWSELLIAGKVPSGSIFFLVTTETAAENSIAFALSADTDKRDVDKAISTLFSISQSSTNKQNKPGYETFNALSAEQMRLLVNSIIVLDGQPVMSDLDSAMRRELFYAVEPRFIEPFVIRLEAWWLRRIYQQIEIKNDHPILSEELLEETSQLREQFKQENLPIDDDILNASFDENSTLNSIFVHQLQLIAIGNRRIYFAMRDYYRAFRQRTRWVNDELLFVGDTDRYEERLKEEWELRFEQMKDELGEQAAEEQKIIAAQSLYKWIENETLPAIRPIVTEPSIAKGSYHMLANELKVGWHPEFLERLRQAIRV